MTSGWSMGGVTLWHYFEIALALSLMVGLLFLLSTMVYWLLDELWDWVADGIAERRARK